MVATLDAAEPPARGTGGRTDMATPRATAASATRDTCREAPTEREAPAPRRTATGGPRSLSVVSGKRQVALSLVDVASSAELLSRLTISDDHAKPVSSNNVGHARTSAIDAARHIPP